MYFPSTTPDQFANCQNPQLLAELHDFALKQKRWSDPHVRLEQLCDRSCVTRRNNGVKSVLLIVFSNEKPLLTEIVLSFLPRHVPSSCAIRKLLTHQVYYTIPYSPSQTLSLLDVVQHVDCKEGRTSDRGISLRELCSEYGADAASPEQV